MTLGQNIRMVRTGRRMKQKDLALAAGYSQKYLSQIELDKVDPRVSVVRRLAVVLGASMDLLVDLPASVPHDR